MPRKGPAPKRPLVVDPVYASPLVTQLVNKILLDGKKSIAETIVYGALEGCPRRRPAPTPSPCSSARWTTSSRPWRSSPAASVARPTRCRSRSSPTVDHPRLRWLVGYSRQRREKTMTERLMNEILDASNGLGAAVKRREDTHKMAESNKAFAHYRW